MSEVKLKTCPACGSCNVSPELPGDVTWIECDDCWHTDTFENWQSDERVVSPATKRAAAYKEQRDRLVEAVLEYQKERNEVTPCNTCKHIIGKRDPEICCDDDYTYDNYEPALAFKLANEIKGDE
jgi:hypothetical protein